MRSARLGLFVLMAIPGLLAGQRGPGRQRSIPQLKAGDIDQLNPMKVVLDRAALLKLDAAKTPRLDSLRQAFSTDAKNFAHVLDTLQHAMRESRDLQEYLSRRAIGDNRERPKNPKDSVARARSDSIDLAKLDQEMQRIMAARNEFGAVLLRIRASYDSYLAATNSLLDDEQRTRVGPWLEAASEELTKRLHWVNQG